jgi:hypothetical protein
MVRQTHVARLIQKETGRQFTWCNQICTDFKDFAFILARLLNVTPIDIVIALAKQIIAQEAREDGPDLDGDNSPTPTRPVKRRVVPLQARKHTEEGAPRRMAV